jgi:3-phenylpropionate/trans-cinnamate dioxygenase ferredoxin component
LRDEFADASVNDETRIAVVMGQHDVGRVDEIPPGTLTHVEVEGIAVCVARLSDGSIHALGDRCTHENYSLSEGELIDTEVECPQHSSRFDVITGVPTGLPAVLPAHVFRVTVRDGSIYIDV